MFKTCLIPNKAPKNVVKVEVCTSNAKDIINLYFFVLIVFLKKVIEADCFSFFVYDIFINFEQMFNFIF